MSEIPTQQSRRTEYAILTLGVLMILGPAFLFFFNIQITERFFGAKDSLAQSPVGEVLQPTKMVRKRGEDDSAFLVAKSRDPIFVGDRILTGKNSSTRISLKDGSVLDLGPDAMIRIEPIRTFGLGGIKKKLKITIENGAVKVKVKNTSTPITLASATGEVLKEIVPPTPAPTPTPAPSATPTPVAVAEASPSPGTSVPVPDATATPVALAEVEEPEVELSFTLEAPKPTPTPTPVPMAVKPAIAPIETPAPIVMTKNDATPTPTASVPESTPVRVAAVEKPQAPAATPFATPTPLPGEMDDEPVVKEEKPLLSRINLVMNTVKNLVVLNKAPKGLLSDNAELSEQSFKLRWKDGGISVNPPYQVWIQYQGEKKSFETRETQYTWELPLEAKGEMEWWVEVALKNGGTIKSSKQTASWKLPTPTLASPTASFPVPPEYLKGPSHNLLLTWKDTRICTGYEVNVSRSSNFKDLDFTTGTKGHFVNFPVKEPGQYYWRVACIYSDDFKLFSANRAFQVKTLNPI